MIATRRKPMTKGVRFEVFKRDQFTCAYCGSHPPAVILHVDHILPVAKGGGNDIDNLITACADCNQGKSSRLLTNIPESLEKKARILREREEQLAGYREVVDDIRRREEFDVDMLQNIFSAAYGSIEFTDTFRASIRRNFLNSLDFDQLRSNAEVSCSRMPNADRALSYFCGMNWRMIKRDL